MINTKIKIIEINIITIINTSVFDGIVKGISFAFAVQSLGFKDGLQYEVLSPGFASFKL